MGDGAPRQRMFVALALGQPAHAALERSVRDLREQHPPLRWVEPAMWHLTLAFLGGVPEDCLPALDAAATAAAATSPPLRLRLDGRAGSFGGRVLYASIEEAPELDALAGALRAALVAEGFTPDTQPFVAHCTLARMPRGTRLPARLLGDYDGPAVTWTARELTVLRSRLRIGGVVHEVRDAHPLTAPAAHLPT